MIVFLTFVWVFHVWHFNFWFFHQVVSIYDTRFFLIKKKKRNNITFICPILSIWSPDFNLKIVSFTFELFYRVILGNLLEKLLQYNSSSPLILWKIYNISNKDQHPPSLSGLENLGRVGARLLMLYPNISWVSQP